MKANRPTKEELLKTIAECNGIHEVAKKYNVSFATIRAWMRWDKINLRPSKEDLYTDCVLGATDKDIGKKYKVTDKSVVAWKKQYGISKHDIKINSFPSSLSQSQINIIEGNLLGDGHLEGFSNRCKNSGLLIEHCLKQKDYVEYLHKELLPFSLEIKYRKRINPFLKKESHLTHIKSCKFRTIRHSLFTEFRNKWYPNGVKIVPEDLELSWQKIAIWFCDDGSNQIGNRCVRRHGILCTNGFTFKEVELLCSKLKELKIETKIKTQKERPVIEISRNSFDYFINQIKPYIKCDCMQYKVVQEKASAQ